MISPGDFPPGRSARSRRARWRARRHTQVPAPRGDAAPAPPDGSELAQPRTGASVPPAPVTLRPHPLAPAPPVRPARPATPPSADPPWPPAVAPPPPRPPTPRPPLGADADMAPTSPGGRSTLTAPASAQHAPRADDTPPGSGGRSPLRNGVEWVVIIGAALIAALVIKTYLLQAFYIPSPSMEPTLKIQDRVLVNKMSYRLHDVHRGDLVVFERPPNDVGQIRDLIKRVIGLPGETVEGKDGTVHVNGQALSEPYLPDGTTTGQFGPKTVPPGYIWVMGDNRGNSSDSRVFGAVSQDRIVGRAFVRVWPINAFGLL